MLHLAADGGSAYCNGFVHIKDVTLHPARLVLEWVTVCTNTCLVVRPPRPTQPGHLAVGIAMNRPTGDVLIADIIRNENGMTCGQIAYWL